MKQLFLLAALMSPYVLLAQQKANKSDSASSPIFMYVEQMPEFPGGQAALTKFLEDNLHYPIEAKKNKIEGRVLVQFVVRKDGTLTNIEIIRSLEKSCDEEALRILKLMPKWTPGKQNGNHVDVYIKLPVTFSLASK